MIFQSFSPCLALREYVEAYHLRHFIHAQGTIVPFKPFHAQPEQCLTFFIRDLETIEYVQEQRKIIRPRSEVTGQCTVRVNRYPGNDFIVLIVNFQPGALYRLTRIPSYQLTNKIIDAESIFSKDISKVNSWLNSADDYLQMINIVETFLIEIFSRLTLDLHPIDQISKHMIKHPENVALDKLAAQSNLCTRQFERKFLERTGVSPKLFIRMARFNKACKMKQLHPGDDWLSVALACGYHDYPHMVRDCKEFASATPTTYFLQDSKAPERSFEFMNPEKYIII